MAANPCLYPVVLALYGGPIALCYEHLFIAKGFVQELHYSTVVSSLR